MKLYQLIPGASETTPKTILWWCICCYVAMIVIIILAKMGELP